MGIKTKVQMSISVLLENGGRSVWLALPANKARFAAALEKIGGGNGDFTIIDYAYRVPSLRMKMLMEKPLSLVNYLASRLNKLSDNDIVKLCAVCESDYYFCSVEQYIDFTFQADSYTLLRGVTDEESLGEYYIDSTKYCIADETVKQYIDRREYGRRLAEAENGVFTSHGYLTSAIGWDLPPIERHIPATLNLKGYINEDLYGTWNDYIIPYYDYEGGKNEA